MSKSETPKTKRILLKLSGEALMGDNAFGISRDTLKSIVGEIKEVVDLGVQLAIVVGGGNIFRGVALGSTGMDTTAVLLATALASCLGTLCMAFMANLPFALSAGMGLNAFMAYTVVAGYGYSWQVALLAVFIEGLIFIVLSLTNILSLIHISEPTRRS